MYALLADAVVLLHLGFVAFVVLGGLAVARRPRLAWLHVPAAAWGVLVEFAGWTCPLTPLELALRARGGSAAWSGSFVERYLLPVLYPDWLTRPTQAGLGLFALVVNVAAYAWVLRRRGRIRATRGSPDAASRLEP
jgi:Protein of Unknown function (DUF2784)